MKKHYITAEKLLQDSVQLALQIAESGWQPDLIAGIWRGGAPVGIAVQEVLDFVGIRTDHIAIRTSSYTSIGNRTQVKVHGLEYLERQLRRDEKLLLVDDVFDTGLSINQVLLELKINCRHQLPDIRIATPYFKPDNNLTARTPDYFLHTTSDWLVFPHELQGLTDHEILQSKPGLNTLTSQLFQARDKLLTDALEASLSDSVDNNTP